MCGITGTLEFRGARSTDETVRRMVRAVEHRGPDGCRVDGTGPMTLGHARLRVIDPSERADQPMWNEDRSVAIVFNGEIYNFRELRRRLENGGCRFRSHSDTEVALKLFEALGDQAVSQLDGMFALAIWDTRSRQLLLARDRAGKKPLFYYLDGKRFVFGSEIKALHAHPEIPRQPQFQALPFYLTYGYFPAPSTAYQGIQQLPPASTLTIDTEGKVEVNRFWQPPYQPNGISNQAEAEKQLRELMRKSVVKRLVADVPLGAFLSGGIDSTIVVGLMSRELSKPVRTFSIGFSGAADFDETRYAESVAETFRTEHTTFRVEPPEDDFIEHLVHHHDGPFGDSSAIPTYLVSQLARKHVTVALNGDGGDELFAGYERFLAAVLLERVPSWVRHAGSGLGRLLPEPSRWSHPFRRAKRMLEVAGLPFEERFQRWCTFFPNAEKELLHPKGPNESSCKVAEHFRRHFQETDDATPLAQLLFLNFNTYLPEDLLVKMDRSTMANGLEARSPFLDTELVEFAGRLPDRFKLRGLTTKFLLREAFKDLIPKEILHRGKMGFGVPLGAWLRGPLRSYLLEHLSGAKPRLFDIIKRDIVASHLETHMSRKADYGQRLFCLLTLEIWLRSL